MQVFPDAKWAKQPAWFRSMKMTSAALGASTSPVEVTNISQHGFWLLLDNEELFLPFSEGILRQRIDRYIRHVQIGEFFEADLQAGFLIFLNR